MLSRSKQSPRSRHLAAVRPQASVSTSPAASSETATTKPADRKATLNERRRAAAQRSAQASSQRKRAPKTTGKKVAMTAQRHSLPGSAHPLTNQQVNARLHDYESRVKQSFDQIVPVLKQIAGLHCEPDFVERAQRHAQTELGYRLPEWILEDAWVTGLDMRRLFAWCVFETYHRMSDDFFLHDPLAGRDGKGFEQLLQDCGFHLMDITPCADGRLAHTMSYVLRLPYSAVRRRSYAGALFDIEDNVQKWIKTEFFRFREGRPNTADAPTRYLKIVLYHYSSTDPEHQGCAAHGSDDAAAARAGLERLHSFRQAIENSFCCGASVDLLLLGLDTDTDAIRVHVPDRQGNCDLNQWLDAHDVYEKTQQLTADAARTKISELIEKQTADPCPGMVKLIAWLFEQNISQIDYVRTYHQGAYADVGHAERFIGAGVGFEEIELRNLTYFAYLSTVEEGAVDLDVGIKIFTGLNVIHRLPVPVIIRDDYRGGVPGARQRAIDHCQRIAGGLRGRYPKLYADGLLHYLCAVRNSDSNDPIEIVSSSLDAVPVVH